MDNWKLWIFLFPSMEQPKYLQGSEPEWLHKDTEQMAMTP